MWFASTFLSVSSVLSPVIHLPMNICPICYITRPNIRPIWHRLMSVWAQMRVRGVYCRSSRFCRARQDTFRMQRAARSLRSSPSTAMATACESPRASCTLQRPFTVRGWLLMSPGECQSKTGVDACTQALTHNNKNNAFMFFMTEKYLKGSTEWDPVHQCEWIKRGRGHTDVRLSDFPCSHVPIFLHMCILFLFNFVCVCNIYTVRPKVSGHPRPHTFLYFLIWGCFMVWDSSIKERPQQDTSVRPTLWQLQVWEALSRAGLVIHFVSQTFFHSALGLGQTLSDQSFIMQ